MAAREARAVAALEAAERWLAAFFRGHAPLPPLPPLAPAGGTPFERAVWGKIATIGFAETRTYGKLARSLGRPDAARAVGAACGKNPLPLFVPCHRVVAAGCGIGGFSASLRRKRWLLAHERRARE